MFKVESGMNTIGKVSVIVPVFNAQETLEFSLRSILDQTYSDIEILAVDDCSSDESGKILMHFERTFPDKFVLLRMSENRGVAAARNEGIRNASGRFIAFCDADDAWLPNKIECQLLNMIANGGSCSHTAYLLCDHHMNPLKTIKAKQMVRLSDMKFANEIGNLTGLYDAHKLGKFYQTEGLGHEDYAMWIDILRHTPSFGVSEVLAKYRKQEGSLSSNKLRAFSWYFRIVVWKFGLFTALLVTPFYVFKSLLKHVNFRDAFKKRLK